MLNVSLYHFWNSFAPFQTRARKNNITRHHFRKCSDVFSSERILSRRERIKSGRGAGGGKSFFCDINDQSELAFVKGQTSSHVGFFRTARLGGRMLRLKWERERVASARAYIIHKSFSCTSSMHKCGLFMVVVVVFSFRVFLLCILILYFIHSTAQHWKSSSCAVWCWEWGRFVPTCMHKLFHWRVEGNWGEFRGGGR